ncbi:Metalloprotease TIKI2 [Merluccius polli]|uniref:Metalloprotease TIKI n=1 Tax=Merluccius polli TaxID=89951 RepID=A0AA47NX67_MERPO|nr:Metalloprotease TIKI2 [Merluccius polli]
MKLSHFTSRLTLAPLWACGGERDERRGEKRKNFWRTGRRKLLELRDEGPYRGHFLGNHSVLDILRQEGYEIVHTPSDHQETPPVEEAAERREETAADPSAESPGVGMSSTVGWGTGSPEEEPEEDGLEDLDDDQDGFPGGLGEEELPHMLLPDSLSQLEEFGRHKRPRKAHRGHGRPRLFSDLWVRMEDSSTPPPNVRIVNGYVTVVPPLTGQEQHRRAELYPAVQKPSPTSPSTHQSRHSSARSGVKCSTLVVPCLLAWLLSHMLLTS